MQETLPEKPDWLKVRLMSSEKFNMVKETVKEYRLNTVCTSAKCPNMFECWDSGNLTFMILGSVCTRFCRFCSVRHGKYGELIDNDEIGRITEASKKLGLSYVSITSVDRDDLEDFGAGHFANTIRALKSSIPGVRVEAVVPDLDGRADLLLKVIDARPDVLTHNIETVERLTPLIRDKRAGYYRSLDVLKNVKRFEPGIATKSSIMLGLGEDIEDVKGSIKHLHESRVDIVIIGQYLRPDEKCVPVHEYIQPEQFSALKDYAESLGFNYVASAPFVRSSYRSAHYYFENVLKKGIRRI
jgi:lipoic acid synthetase